MRCERFIGRNKKREVVTKWKKGREKGAWRTREAKERDSDWTIAGCRCRAQKQAAGRRRCARLYTASTATTALTCHHIDIVIICKCARTYSRRWGLESNVLFWVMEALGKEIIVIHYRKDLPGSRFLFYTERDVTLIHYTAYVRRICQI